MRRSILSLVLVLCAVPALAAGVDTRTAAARALPAIQRSAASFVSQRACFSCHHNGLAIMTLREAGRHGLRVDGTAVDLVEARTFGVLRSPNAVDAAIQATTLSDPTPNDSLLLMAAHAAGIPRNLAAEVLAQRLIQWQRRDGRWMTSDFRPPHSSSEFTATATAIAAIRAYAPEALASARDTAVARATAWLSRSWPQSTEDATFRLIGLVWGGAPREDVAAAARVLLSMQLPGGGWPQLPDYRADAYSTGEALFALNLGGIDTASREWQQGARFLVSTQAADGTWRVRTRMLSPAEVSPPYFTTGFPYRQDEYLSFAGTCWAVMGLLAADGAHGEPAAGVPHPASADSPEPAWLRTALFGSARDLEAALDAGLDPNSRTSGGTTVLMAAALDAGKTRLLLSRGADATPRTSSRVDALTIAASHPGTGASVQALLDGGAAAQPPDGIRVRRTPLVAAALAGDLPNVQLLLGRGATPSAQAVSEAITFGHTDVVRALIEAGADVGGVDSTGINLLHWATITNRPGVVPLLAKARVPVNALDDFGFTPLMYAATIDHGDTAIVRALLEAGADVTLRNDEGRTPAQQAQRLKHLEIVDALRAR